MTQPLVSVCLPNLNNRKYLDERVETIVRQSYTNWELVVSDNYSDDGAWEFFEGLARRDARVSIAQAPKEGMYANWNNCLRRARGEYVYIATSDDAMALDCLEQLVTALERFTNCDIAHCPLRTVDTKGEPVEDPRWPDCSVFGDGLPAEFLERQHLRMAPYDGLLHLVGRMVYPSITQLLIRAPLFKKTGDFISRWGSIGDVNWDMKASLVANTVHVPGTWATFRVHPVQATAGVNFHSDEYAQRIEEMIVDAVSVCRGFLAPSVVAGLSDHWLEWTRDMRTYYAGLRNRRSVLKRRSFQIEQFLVGTKAARSELLHRMCGRTKWTDRAPSEIRRWLTSMGMETVLEVEAEMNGSVCAGTHLRDSLTALAAERASSGH